MNHDIDATIAANAEALERRRAEAQYYISCAGLSPCYKGESPSGPARTQNVTKVFAASSKSGAVPVKKRLGSATGTRRSSSAKSPCRFLADPLQMWVHRLRRGGRRLPVERVTYPRTVPGSREKG